MGAARRAALLRVGVPPPCRPWGLTRARELDRDRLCPTALRRPHALSPVTAGGTDVRPVTVRRTLDFQDRQC